MLEGNFSFGVYDLVRLEVVFTALGVTHDDVLHADVFEHSSAGFSGVRARFMLAHVLSA